MFTPQSTVTIYNLEIQRKYYYEKIPCYHNVEIPARERQISYILDNKIRNEINPSQLGDKMVCYVHQCKQFYWDEYRNIHEGRVVLFHVQIPMELYVTLNIQEFIPSILKTLVESNYTITTFVVYRESIRKEDLNQIYEERNRTDQFDWSNIPVVPTKEFQIYL